ncbi:hypothetical protein Tco_1060538, partial [Tanacetum coccineum]
MAAPGGANQIARHVIDDLIEFSEETFVDGYMSFFKSQQIAKSRGFINRMREEANTARNLVGRLNALIAEMEALEDHGELFDLSQQITESRGFINRMREEANTARNLVGQLNALIAKMEALEDQGEVFNTLMDLRDDKEVVRTKLKGLNELITQADPEIEIKEAQIHAMKEMELIVVFDFKYALVMYYCRSEVNVDSNDSWIWKALLSLKEKAKKHNGYLSGMTNGVKWHNEWKDVFPELISILVPSYSIHKDKAVWRCNNEWLQIGESNSRLRVEKSRPEAFETMAELSSLYIRVLLFKRYGSIWNILHGRNELLEKIIGCVVDSGGVSELDPKDHLVNYDNDNDMDDLGYESEVYLDGEEEEDENNHSNGNVVKSITRLSKFRREYEKPDGIKLSVTFNALNRISWSHRALFSSFLGDPIREYIGLKILSWKKVGSEARDKLWDEITRYFDVDLTFRKQVKSAAAKMTRSKSVYQYTIGRGGYANVKQKLIENKEIEPDEELPRCIMWLKGRVNKDGQFPDDKIRSVGDKLKETEDKIKKGTLKVDHGTDAMTVELGKEKGGYASVVGSGVTYKRYFDLPRSRQAFDERIALLQSQLDNERRERQEKELEIQNLSNKMLETEGMVSKLMNRLVAQGRTDPIDS